MGNEVLLEVQDGIALLTLNRPERRNAMNQALLTQLYNSIEEAASNESIHAVIITGSGTTFCSGLDLAVIAKENLNNPRGDGKGITEVFAACRKPIIGAVNGHAITGGFELALNCDFLIGSDNASFADTHVRVGIHPGWGMTQLLQQAIGRRRAKQMSFTGAFMKAEEAFKWGLLNEIVPADRLVGRALEIAREIVECNQEMVTTVKNLIEYRDTATMENALEYERKVNRVWLKARIK